VVLEKSLKENLKESLKVKEENQELESK